MRDDVGVTVTVSWMIAISTYCVFICLSTHVPSHVSTHVFSHVNTHVIPRVDAESRNRQNVIKAISMAVHRSRIRVQDDVGVNVGVSVSVSWMITTGVSCAF